MSDLKSPKLIYFKASLFLLIIIGSVALALIEFPSWKLAVLILIAIWWSWGRKTACSSLPPSISTYPWSSCSPR